VTREATYCKRCIIIISTHESTSSTSTRLMSQKYASTRESNEGSRSFFWCFSAHRQRKKAQQRKQCECVLKKTREVVARHIRAAVCVVYLSFPRSRLRSAPQDFSAEDEDDEVGRTKMRAYTLYIHAHDTSAANIPRTRVRMLRNPQARPPALTHNSQHTRTTLICVHDCIRVYT